MAERKPIVTNSGENEQLQAGDFISTNRAIIGIQIGDAAGSDLTAGDDKAYCRINSALNGYNLTAVAANTPTASSSGDISIMIHNDTDTQDMLSTALTIDATEEDSSTAATPAVINTTYDDVATGDRIRIDLDGAGTGVKVIIVELTFTKP